MTSAPSSRAAALLTLALALVLGQVAWDAATLDVFDPDVWWVAAAGRTFLATGAVPRTNAWSYSAPAHPWVMHEWGLGPVYALAASRFGAAGFALLALLAVLLAAGALCLHARAHARSPVGHVLAVLAPLLLFADRLRSPRPTSVAEVLPLALSALALSPRWRAPHLAAAVALELLWANAHGSFPLGIVLLAFGAACAREPSRLRWMAVLGAVLATLCQPYGLALHRLVLSYLHPAEGSAVRVVHEQVLEFWPLWRALREPRGGPDPLAAGALALVALGALAALRGERREKLRGLFVLLLCAGALRQARHLELAGLLGCMWLLEPAERALAPRVGARVELPARALAVAVLAAWGVAFGAWMVRAQRPEERWIAASLGGPEVRALLERVPAGSRVYTPWKPASLVLWYGAPRGLRVFYDTRNDCYPGAVAAVGLGVDDRAGDTHVAELLLRGWPFDAALLTERHPMARVLAARSEWRAAERRGAWVLWLRAVGEAPGRVGEGRPPPG